MTDTFLQGCDDEPLEPWESEQSRFDARHGWTGERRAVRTPTPQIDLAPQLDRDPEDLRTLVELARQYAEHMLAARQASIQEILALRSEIASLNTAKRLKVAQLRAPAAWLPEVKELLSGLMESDDDQPIDPRTLSHALRFAELLPGTVPIPDVGVHPDGQIAFEWQLARRTILTISLSPEGLVYFAGLYGDSRNHGVERFGNAIPEAIIANLERLFRESSESSLSEA